MPKLCEWRFPNSEVVRSEEISLYFRALVRGVEITPLGVGKDGVLTEGLLVGVEA